MAPYTVSPLPSYDSLTLSDKERIKIRKPLVEKMRRDRINSCIEQLKSLLEREFHSQDPNAKLEKADILEMTVSFLKRQRLQLGLGPVTLAQRDHYSYEGYPQAWRGESVVCGSPPQVVTTPGTAGCSQGQATVTAHLREPHSPLRSPQDLVLSSSPASPSSPSSTSPCSSPSPVLLMSPPAFAKHNSVSVIHHASGRRSMWRPWQ